MTKIILVIFAGVILSASFAFAQGTVTPATNSLQGVKDIRSQVRDNIQKEVKTIKDAVRQDKTNLKETLKTEGANVREKIGENRDAFKEETRMKLDAFKTATAEDKQEILREVKAKREQLQADAATLKQELRDNAEELRTEFRDKVKDARERARIAVAHHRSLIMTMRFRAALARLGNLIERIETRILALQNRGVDISSVTPLVEEAKNLKAQAEATLESLKAKYESLLSGTDPKTVLQEAKALATELKSQLESLRAKLREIVTALKALTPPEATTTSTSEEQTP